MNFNLYCYGVIRMPCGWKSLCFNNFTVRIEPCKLTDARFQPVTRDSNRTSPIIRITPLSNSLLSSELNSNHDIRKVGRRGNEGVKTHDGLPRSLFFEHKSSLVANFLPSQERIAGQPPPPPKADSRQNCELALVSYFQLEPRRGLCLL